ncbi:hypothetical protein ABPG74_004580 [Tetrahymena malaccensis]
MDIESLLSSLSFEESQQQQHQFDALDFQLQPQLSSQSSTSISSSYSLCSPSYQQHYQQQIPSQQDCFSSMHLAKQSSSISSCSTSSSAWSDSRFIPSRKQSKYNVMLSSAHEVKMQKSTKGQFLHDENDISIAQLYKKHVLELNNSKNENKLHFCDSKVNSKQFGRKGINASAASSNALSSGLPYGPDSNILLNNENSCNGLESMILSMQKTQAQHRINEQLSASNSSSFSRKQNQISYSQIKVLDAPGLIDDFYLNLLDWSQRNLLAVALGSTVYVWNGQNNQVLKMCDVTKIPNPLIQDQSPHVLEQNKVQSIQWSQSGNLLGVGDANGIISIYDLHTQKRLNSLPLHTDRIGSLAWRDDFIVASGSRDKSIFCTDIRISTPNNKRCIQRFTGHKQEVCGLKWSFDHQMLASGGNDNKLFVWSLRTSTHLNKFQEHKAGVKAIAWSPHQHGLLVSGGGTADRTIRFWNTQLGEQVDCIEVNSQVCNLVFSKNENEFVSTHGFQDNDIIVWKYPTLQKIACLTGHTCRVLQLGLSPCSTKIVTGAGDETLRFWDVFKSNKNIPNKQGSLLDTKVDLR